MARRQLLNDVQWAGLLKAGEDEAIGRSKGGLSTKINATVDALGKPIGFALTPGQACKRDCLDPAGQ
jgi:hypothetical protein